MSTNDEIYESGEDYLECILRLQNRQGDVKSIDVANAMNYSKPSISRAMKILAEKGFIQMDKKKYIQYLTEEGLKKAEAVYKRHLLIKEALITLLDVSHLCKLCLGQNSQAFYVNRADNGHGQHGTDP